MRIKRTGLCALLAAGGILPVYASGGAADKLIQPTIGGIFWTTLIFLAMLLLLGRFAWKPLLGALDARAKGIKDALDQAASGRREAEALLLQHQELLNAARRERAEALAQGQRDAEVAKADILAEARRQRDRMMEQTEAQIAVSMRQARAELRSLTADLAIQAAEKLMAKNLDDPTQRRLVEDYLADLERTATPSKAAPPS